MADAIRVTNVTKRFGSKVAVNDVSFSVEAGMTWGLVGPNGAGKTTLFSMLAGYLKPTGGNLEVCGHEPHQAAALRGRVGVLPQDAPLPTGESVGHFLSFAARLQGFSAESAPNEARRVLDEVDGTEWFNVRAQSLSHGMTKRVALAQALIGDPELLLLDEPTAGLDPRAAMFVREVIRKRKRTATVVVSSHDLHEIEELCDGVAHLELGRLLVQSTVADLALSGNEVLIELGTNDAAMVSDALATLRATPNIVEVKADDEGTKLVVRFDRNATDGQGAMAAAFFALHEKKVRVIGVTQRGALQDRLFKNVPGRG